MGDSEARRKGEKEKGRKEITKKGSKDKQRIEWHAF